MPQLRRRGALTDQLAWVSAVRGGQVSMTPKALGSPYRALEFRFGGTPG